MKNLCKIMERPIGVGFYRGSVACRTTTEL